MARGEGRVLDSVGRGTVLIGRYRLEERLRARPASASWRAFDETLDRSVQIALLDPVDPRTADVLDAARRVTLAKDPRLAQILDVSRDRDLAFIVVENLPGRTLSEAVAGSPLPAVEARRLVGETAEALSTAASRGLYHQHLTPEHLVVGNDGSVKVIGTAVETAATGAGSQDPDVAARSDAAGLVCLLYAALTGRWPGTAPSRLPAAPRVGGRPVSPEELVPGVPRDLDGLCTTVLGTDSDPPAGSAEVARRLAPWAATQPLTDPRGLLLAGRDTPRPPSVTASVMTPDTTTPDAGPADVPEPGRTGTVDAVRSGTVPAAAGTVPGGPAPGGPAPGGPAPGGPAAGGGAAVVPASAAMAAAASTAAPAGGVGLRSRLASGFTRPPLPVHRPTTDPEALPRGSFRGWEDLSTIGIPVAEEDEAPLVPFVPSVMPEEPIEDQSRFVIAVVVSFILFVALIAAISLRSFGLPTALIPGDVTRPLPTAAGAPATTPTGTAAGIPQVPPTPTPTPTPSPAASPLIAGVQAIDPQGDGSENDGQATRAIDGDPATKWKSNYYETAEFAGLKKGLGLVLDLGAGELAQVQQVTVDVAGSGGAVELRTAPGPGLDGSAVVAEAAIKHGRAVLTPTRPVKSRLLVLWFTKLPKTGGKYQLLVSEINVR